MYHQKTASNSRSVIVPQKNLGLSQIEITDKLVERFMNKIEFFNPDGCWFWVSTKNKDGYGKFWVTGHQQVPAHKLSYYFSSGVCSKNPQFVCHSCDNPSCVNPAHLWIGDAFSNQKDSVRKRRQVSIRKTQCKNGHEFSEENTYVWRTQRCCIKCRKIVALNRYKKISPEPRSEE